MTPDDPGFWISLAKSAPAIAVALVWAELRVLPILRKVARREQRQERLMREVAVKLGVAPERVAELLQAEETGDAWPLFMKGSAK